MIDWKLSHFDQLTPAELYAIMQLRSEVFVVEQNCVYLDADGKDLSCHHLMGWQVGKLVACTRLLPPGLSFHEASIGRVTTSPKARGLGIGRQLMQVSMQHIYALYGQVPIHIGAQLYLLAFYQSFGFVPCSTVYLEDGIQHIEMIKPD